MLNGKMSLDQMKVAALLVFAVAMWVALKAMGSGNNQLVPVMPQVTTESLLIGADQVEYTISFAETEEFLVDQVNLAKIKKASQLASAVDSDVVVRGHAVILTKSDGSAIKEFELAQKRADSVASLLKDMGLPEDRLNVISMGQAGVVFWEDNPTTDGLALYQRVEISVIPRGDL